MELFVYFLDCFLPFPAAIHLLHGGDRFYAAGRPFDMWQTDIYTVSHVVIYLFLEL
jgi:hypothetical protein